MAAELELKYKLFIERAAASKLVWGLKNKKGWANSHSSESEEVDVIPFWSDRALAKTSAKDDWRDYAATEISLADFLENWCMEMGEEEVLAGINWDANMIGKEVDGLEVALDILNQLSTIQSAIKFKDYGSIDEFITEIRESIDEG